MAYGGHAPASMWHKRNVALQVCGIRGNTALRVNGIRGTLPPLAATLAGQAEKPTRMLTITKGGLHPAYSCSISPPFAGSTGIPLNVPPFMPTFTTSRSVWQEGNTALEMCGKWGTRPCKCVAQAQHSQLGYGHPPLAGSRGQRRALDVTPGEYSRSREVTYLVGMLPW